MKQILAYVLILGSFSLVLVKAVGIILIIMAPEIMRLEQIHLSMGLLVQIKMQLDLLLV